MQKQTRIRLVMENSLYTYFKAKILPHTSQILNHKYVSYEFTASNLIVKYILKECCLHALITNYITAINIKSFNNY